MLVVLVYVVNVQFKLIRNKRRGTCSTTNVKEFCVFFLYIRDLVHTHLTHAEQLLMLILFFSKCKSVSK